MATKQAAMYSIYVIMFSQISSLLSTVIKGNVPPFQPAVLLLMAACGILGGLAGSRINKKIENEMMNLVQKNNIKNQLDFYNFFENVVKLHFKNSNKIIEKIEKKN